jgi:hypothetical protein
VVLDRGSKVVAGLRSLGFFILGVGIGVWAVEWWNHGFTYAARHGVGFNGRFSRNATGTSGDPDEGHL